MLFRSMDLVLNVPVDVVTFRKRALKTLRWLAIVPLIAIGGLGGFGMGEMIVVFLVVLLLVAAKRQPPTAF